MYVCTMYYSAHSERVSFNFVFLKKIYSLITILFYRKHKRILHGQFNNYTHTYTSINTHLYNFPNITVNIAVPANKQGINWPWWKSSFACSNSLMHTYSYVPQMYSYKYPYIWHGQQIFKTNYSCLCLWRYTSSQPTKTANRTNHDKSSHQQINTMAPHH